MNAITVKKPADVTPYEGPHAIAGVRFRALRQALGVTSWGMNIIELDPHCDRCPKHDHKSDGHEEVYVVLEGSVLLVAAGEETTLNAGDMVRVDGSVVRQLVTKASGAVILALGGTPGKAYAPSMGG